MEGLYIKIPSTYCKMATYFRCISLSSFPKTCTNRCGLSWNPWGNTVQIYYCIWPELGLVHSKANGNCDEEWTGDTKEGILEIKYSKSLALLGIWVNMLKGLATRGCMGTYAVFTILRFWTILYPPFSLTAGRIGVLHRDWQGTKGPCLKYLSMRCYKSFFTSNFRRCCLLLG